jgi:hypothetical protein
MNIVILEKNGNVKTSTCKDNFDICKLYKSCKFRKDKDFGKRHTWELTENIYISVFSKNDGRASTENKYELPPPIDNDLYFGNIAVVCHSEEELTNENLINFTEEKWKVCYEKLMGGFEDLDDEEESSEEEYVDPENLTEQGYDKSDGFVVDDSLEEAENSEEEYILSDKSTEEDGEEDGEEDEEEEGEEDGDSMPDLVSDSEEDSMPDLVSDSEEEESDNSNELSEEDYSY